MAAFDRVLSGIPALDQAPDPIRMGDNVVWRVSDPDEFRCFAGPLCGTGEKGRAEYQETICLADVSGRNCELYHDLTNEHILIRI